MLAKIQKLKQLFDTSSHELKNNYWTDELLEIYSETLGERIKWKWQHFFNELKLKKIHPEELFSKGQILDWGCGPGTASVAFIESCLNPQNFAFNFEDRSKAAVDFSEKRISALAPKQDPFPRAAKLTLISYVLSELGSAEETTLINKIKSADVFLWIDAGTLKESRRLSKIRNDLLADFNFLHPCPHSKLCPLSGTQNPNDWCHHFAHAPQEIFHSAKWAEISKTLKIDLRSLPYTCLYGVKKSLSLPTREAADQRLGRPRVGKHEITLDYCTTNAEYTKKKITKRDHPDLFKKLRKE